MSAELLIGAHTSIGGGVENALLEGAQIGATTIQMFTANQKRWEGKPLTPEAIELWQKTLKETQLKKVMSHDSYLINLGSPDPAILAKSRKAFQEELTRCQQLDLAFLNFHPGAAKDCPAEHCLDKIAESLLQLEEQAQQGETTLLLETTAGQGSCVGWKFEEIGYIIDKVKNRIPIGVCIDTCHIFVSGYDIRTKEGWDKTLQEFDRVIGLNYLQAFHLNDSVKGLGSRVDRHQPLGKGEIGLECFRVVMTHPILRPIPKYLETPGGLDLWREEIKLLRQFASQK
jgi:deoxyribonuclease-4